MTMGTERIRVRRATVSFGRAFLAPALVVAVLASPPTLAQTGAEETPTTAFRALQLGYLALEANELESAMAYYSTARELAVGDSQRFNAELGLGSAALELGRLAEAREALERAHDLKPGETGATYLLGVTCRRQGAYELAVSYLAEAAVREPDPVPALVELGIAYGALGRHQDAERVCRRAIADDPDNVDARLGLAVALFHQDENDAALKEFREVLERDPDNLRGHLGLGLALHFAGDRDGALAELSYLRERAPQLAEQLHGWIYPDG